MPERQRRKYARLNYSTIVLNLVLRDPGDADILRRRNQALAARVKELEGALAKAGGSAGPSPASSGEHKTDDEDTVYSQGADDHTLTEAFGTLTIEETGRTSWHGIHFSPPSGLPEFTDRRPDRSSRSKHQSTSLGRVFELLYLDRTYMG